MPDSNILALDQGTTSSKAVILNQQGQVIAVSDNFRIDVRSPHAGWIEYHPEQMLESLVSAGRNAIEKSGIDAESIAAVGLANQGETVIAFDRETGIPITPAISWQDRRTTSIIDQWREKGWSEAVTEKTGLRLDPYFSAAKLRWILDQVPAAADLLEKNRLCLATSDAWLIARLTDLQCCVTDLATASRTMLLNLKSRNWDAELLQWFEIPATTLPHLVGNTEAIGSIASRWFGAELTLGGLCADQQAALFGQRCFHEGEVKLTYGTGCFMLANIGTDPATRSTDLLTSIGWQVKTDIQYVLDGGIYTAGAVIDWMIDRLQLLKGPEEIDPVLNDTTSSGDIFFLPALSGLAAPYWEPDTRGAWVGLSLSHDRRDLIRSAVEGIAFRVKDIFELMLGSGLTAAQLKVDGGLTRSRFLMQLQADLLGVDIEVTESVEATAVGVGLMAGIAAGVFSSFGDLPAAPPSRRIYRADPDRQQRVHQDYQRWRNVAEELARWPKQGIG